MKIILILVLLSHGGSEVITADFADLSACEDAARRTFQGLNPEVELRPLEPAEGVELLEGTMVAYDPEGGQLGVFSCNPAQSGFSNRLGERPTN